MATTPPVVRARRSPALPSHRARPWLSARRREAALLALILAAAAWLRFWHIGAQSLWLDEAQSLAHTSGSFARVIHDVAQGEATPPLYFLLLRVVTGWSTSEVAVRSLSAALGVAGVLALFLLARRLLGPTVGLISAALLAVSPFAVSLSQETRAYTLLMALSLISWYLLLGLTWRPTRWAWAAYVLLTAAALYTHYYTVFTIGAQAVIVWLYRRERPGLLRGWLLAAGGMAITTLPWVPSCLHQFRVHTGYGGQDFRPQVGFLWIPYTFFQFSLGFSAAHVRTTHDLVRHALLPALSAAAFGTAAATGLWQIRRHRAAITWLVVPVCLATSAALLANLRVRSFTPIYLTGVMPLYLVVLASGLLALRRRVPLLLLVAASITGLTVLSLHHYYFEPSFAREDWRSAARYIAAQARPADVVALHKSYLQVPFDYYYRGAAPEVGLPHQALPSDDPRLAEQLRRLSLRRRVWLVVAHNYDTQDYYPHLLATRFCLISSRTFPAIRPITVYLFVPSLPPVPVRKPHPGRSVVAQRGATR